VPNNSARWVALTWAGLIDRQTIKACRTAETDPRPWSTCSSCHSTWSGDTSTQATSHPVFLLAGTRSRTLPHGQPGQLDDESNERAALAGNRPTYLARDTETSSSAC